MTLSRITIFSKTVIRVAQKTSPVQKLLTFGRRMNFQYGRAQTEGPYERQTVGAEQGYRYELVADGVGADEAVAMIDTSIPGVES